MHICFEHGEVTAWGCRQCLRRKIEKIVSDASDELGKKLELIFARVGEK